MVIGLKLNRPEYRNDVAEEIRLFAGLSTVAFLDDGEPEEKPELTLDMQLKNTGAAYMLEATAGDQLLKTSFLLPDRTPLVVKKVEKRQLKLAAYTLLKKLFPEVETPWGSLTGIRPTKLFREVMAKNDEKVAVDQFLDVYDVSLEKTMLAGEICARQAPFIASVQPRDIDIYIGIPFCKTRCLYCSFASEVLESQQLLESYLAGLKADILAGAALVREGGYRVRAMYLGGGTPTILNASQLDGLLGVALDAYGGFGQECTVEAGRPDTIDREKLAVLKKHGVGRISINPQTMNDETLVRVGRTHTAADTVHAFAMARETGFACINMDVIAGLPGENRESMENTLTEIGKLKPENLTVHALAIKRSSELKLHLEEYPLPDAAAAGEMIRMGGDQAKKMGMGPYYMYRQKYMSGNLENVGYAKIGKDCIYNIDMMEETVSILAHGAGSMTKRVFSDESRIERLPSPKDVPTYLAKLPRLTEEKRRFFLGSAD